jgi:hypothetical protein
MKITELQENITSSAGIAGDRSTLGGMQQRAGAARHGEREWRDYARDPEARRAAEQRGMADAIDQSSQLGRQQAQLKAAKAKIAKQKSFLGRLKSFLDQKQRETFRISESFDMQDVMSRLSDLEGNSENQESTVSYGIEDDQGNLMKVTVRRDQAEEFEERLATELADAARRQEVTGEKTSISMAELLLKLNDEFDILDASFPTIPQDAVYNADKVQYGVADTSQEQPMGTDPMAMGGEMGGDPMAMGGDNLDAFPDGDPMAGGEGDMGADPMAAGGEGDMGADPMASGEGGEGDEFFDDASVEDMPADDVASANPEENLLTAILSMLTADAEARKEEANAKAEEARAKQAEYTAMAAKNAIEQQEEVLRMEAEIENQKKQEKEAKRIADLAKYRVNRVRGMGESAKPTFGQFIDIICEFDELDSETTLNRQRAIIRQKFAPAPGDSPETAAFKRDSMLNAMKEIDAKIKQARITKRYRDAAARRDGEQNKKPMGPNEQRQAQQNALLQQPQPGATDAVR